MLHGSFKHLCIYEFAYLCIFHFTRECQISLIQLLFIDVAHDRSFKHFKFVYFSVRISHCLCHLGGSERQWIVGVMSFQKM